jgi:hypothetical protein
MLKKLAISLSILTVIDIAFSSSKVSCQPFGYIAPNRPYEKDSLNWDETSKSNIVISETYYGNAIYSAYRDESLPLYNWDEKGLNSASASTPIRLQDEFTKETWAAVLDNNFEDNILNGDKRGLASMWGSNSSSGFVKANFYIRIGNRCGVFRDCSESANQSNFVSLEVKAGERTFRVTNLTQRGSFILTKEETEILRNAPDDQNAKIRLTDNAGKYYTYEIGTGTVKAWKTIYKSP